MSSYYPANLGDALSALPDGFEASDPSLDGQNLASFDTVLRLAPERFDALFLEPYELGYISGYMRSRALELRVVSHPRSTTTCFEKAELLGWDSLNIIKALYFEDLLTQQQHAIVIPETGCFVDMQRIGRIVGIDEPGRLRKASAFPKNMERGTCSPFITPKDLVTGGGKVAGLWFDLETLQAKRASGALDDFSFGVDHRLSLQLGYVHAYELLCERYPGAVHAAELLGLSFKEVMVRQKGKIKLRYEFESLNYRTAAFFSRMHGAGDVTISNDFVDELDLPEPLKHS